jgi:hypothetical protein
MPDCFSLVQYRTSSGTVNFFHSGTGLTGCRTVRHYGILNHISRFSLKKLKYIIINMTKTKMRNLVTLSLSDTQSSFTCFLMLQAECRNAGIPIKSSVWHHYFTVSFPRLVRHRHSGIVVSPAPLVTD